MLKWLHYFDLYHRHLQKFIDRPVTVVEVGVYSGGSMPMWRHYFGEHCRVHGVDIQEECKMYEDAHTTIHIGDQADRAFWKRFRESVPAVDVLIDDGGHQPEQQMVTLEEMLPPPAWRHLHLRRRLRDRQSIRPVRLYACRRTERTRRSLNKSLPARRRRSKLPFTRCTCTPSWW